MDLKQKIALSSPLPDLRQVFAPQRVGGRDREFCNVFINRWPFAGQPLFNIPVAAIWVSTYYAQAFAAHVFMANTSWYDKDIAGRHFYLLSAFAAQLKQR